MNGTATDSRQLLVARLDVQYDNLRRAHELIGSAAIDEDLRDAVRVPFESLLERHRRRLDEVRALVDAGDTVGAWQLLQLVRTDIMTAHAECLAFVQGALARSAGLDGGICALADHLLDELAARTDIPWARLTIPADAELVTFTANVIRLKYTDVAIWRLPIMAHEFGHIAVGKLERPRTRTKPLEEFVERDETLRPKLHELCSDVFGVFTMGPAFAAMTILLELDPGAPDEEVPEASHLSDSKRAYAITAALARLDDDGPGFSRPFRSLARRHAAAWAAARTAVGKQPELAEEARAQLDTWLWLIWKPLDDLLPLARYSAASWARALRIEDALRRTDARAAETPELEKGDTLVDVLNAAWSARSSGAGQQVEAHARGMATAVAALRRDALR